jgi:uncharacterized iron-regulated membrane protein
MIRKILFWSHLSAGIAAGIVVAIMSFTGVAISFEPEILGWIDRDVRSVAAAEGAAPLPFDKLDAAVTAHRPEFKTSTIVVPRDAGKAYEYRAGRDGSVFVDPYTGTVREPQSGAAHDVMHVMEDWHRTLGMEGEQRALGKLITGICNLAFLFLCLTGLYMWFPRRWTARALRPVALFAKGMRGRARDYNWHNVFGCWSVLVLIVLVATASVFSFGWANRLVFTLAGEEPPARGRGGQAGPTVQIAPPAEGQTALAREVLVANVARAYPQWESISIDLPNRQATATTPFNVVVQEPALFATRGRTTLSVDQYRGEIVSKSGFADRSTGQQARVWVRFLHTGEAFGMPGRIIATLATAASLFLVYTGFALSYRRFFGKKKSEASVAAEAAA